MIEHLGGAALFFTWEYANIAEEIVPASAFVNLVSFKYDDSDNNDYFYMYKLTFYYP